LGYYQDLLDQESSAGNPDEMSGPPAPRPFNWKAAGKALLAPLGDISAYEQENLSGLAAERGLDKYLPKPLAEGVKVASGLKGLEAAGKLIGAPFAAAGTLTAGERPPWQALGDPNTYSAIAEGMKAGGEAGKGLATPTSVAGALPGAGALKAVSAADVAMGAGDIFKGVEERDPLRAAFGGVRIGGGGIGLAAARNLKPAAAAAASDAMQAHPYFKTAKTSAPDVQLSPEAISGVEYLANNTLKALHEVVARGGFEGAFPGEVPAMPPQRLVVDPSLPIFAHQQDNVVTLGRYGIVRALRDAQDAQGVVENLRQLLAHEMQHATERGGASGMLPGPPGTKAGHASGSHFDDRLKSYTQLFREQGIADAVKNHPLLAEAAGDVERTGLLKGAFLPPEAAHPHGATFPLRDLQLFHETMGTPEAARPVIPEHFANRPEAPYPTLEVEGPRAVGDEFYPKSEKPEAPKAPDRAMRALTGRQLRVPTAPVTDIVELPRTKAVLDYVRARRQDKAAVGRSAKPKAVEALDELEKAFAQGRVTDVAQLKELGIQPGELWSVYNDVDKYIRNQLGGKETKEGAALFKRLKAVTAKAPRLFGQSPRQLGVSPRMTRASLRPQRFEQPGTPFEQASTKQAAAEDAAKEVLRLRQKPPKGGTTEEVKSWAEKLSERARQLAEHVPFLGAKFRRATTDTFLGADRLSMKELRARRRAAKLAEKGGGEEPRQMGEGFYPEEYAEGRRILEEKLARELAEAAKPSEPPVLREQMVAPPKEKPKAKKRAKLTGKGKIRTGSAEAAVNEKIRQRAIEAARSADERARRAAMQKLATMEKPARIPYTGERLKEPLKVAERSKPAAPEQLEGKPVKKAEPFVYRGRENMEPLRRKLETPEPLGSAASGSRADQMATQRVAQLLNAGKQVTAEVLGKVGFTPAGRLRARLALARAARPIKGVARSAEAIAQRFMTGLHDIAAAEMQPRLGERPRFSRYPEGATAKESRARLLEDLKERGSKKPLLGEAAKRLPERKLSPYVQRKGAALPRKEVGRTQIVWADELGNVLEEQLRKGDRAIRELGEELGLKLKGKQLVPATVQVPGTEKVFSPSRMVSKIATSKAMLPKVVDSLEKSIKLGKAAGRDVSKVEALLSKIKGSELWKAARTTAQPVAFERFAVPKTSAKGTPIFEKTPLSMDALTEKAAPTGGRAGMRRLEQLEADAAKGELTVKTQASQFKSSEKLRGKAEPEVPGTLTSRFAAKPRKARGLIIPETVASRLAKRKFIEENLKQGETELKSFIDRLGAEGRLKNVAEGKASLERGYEYRNLVEDYLDGRQIDFEEEYVLHRGELGKFKEQLRRKLDAEWEQIQVEGAEGRVTARAQTRVRKAYEEALLPKETQEWLDKQTIPRTPGGGGVVSVRPKDAKTSGTSTPGMVDWVKAQVALGKLKPTEELPAIDYLRTKQRKFEESVGRGVSAKQRERYKMKSLAGRGEDLMERIAIQLEKEGPVADSTPDPWDLEAPREAGYSWRPEGEVADTAILKNPAERRIIDRTFNMASAALNKIKPIAARLLAQPELANLKIQLGKHIPTSYAPQRRAMILNYADLRYSPETVVDNVIHELAHHVAGPHERRSSLELPGGKVGEVSEALVSPHTKANMIKRAGASAQEAKFYRAYNILENSPEIQKLKAEFEKNIKRMQAQEPALENIPLRRGRQLDLFSEEPREVGRGFYSEEVAALEKKLNKVHQVKESTGARGSWQAWETVGEWANVTRPLKTMADVSAAFRQMFLLTSDQIAQDIANLFTRKRYNPQADASFVQNMWDSLKVFGTQKNADAATAALKADPWFRMGEKMGVNYIYEGAGQHEAWVGFDKLHKVISAVEKKVPPARALRWLADGSKRSFAYYINKGMRDATKFGLEYLKYLHDVDPQAFKITKKEEFKTLAEHINTAASRAKLPGGEKINKFVNHIFYSGQLNFSRGKYLWDLTGGRGFKSYKNPALTRYARRQFMRAVAGASAVNGFVLTLAALTGQEPTVELDSRSTDFGKIKVGDIVYDGGGGWFQFLRAGRQVISGEEKDRETGIIEKKNVGGTIWNFLRSKLGPGAGAVIDTLAQRNLEGQAIDFKNAPVSAATTLAWNLVEPMSVSDMNAVVKENPQVSWLIPMMLMGNGIQEDLPRGAKAWRTDEDVKMRERANRKELRLRGVAGPNLGTTVPLPGRDSSGRLNYYNMTPAELEEFQKEYMPLVTKLLNDFVNSQAYAKIPEERKRARLRSKVHQLNQRFGVATRKRGEYRKKFKTGEVERSNRENEEVMSEFMGGRISRPRLPGEDEE